MINFYLLSDAIPATLFGIFAMWAAGSRRHWFVRLAVASAALLLILLIPAYEVVVEFGLGMLLAVIGVTAWRNWRQRLERNSATQASWRRIRPRVSLETLLLVMVIVAVATAVAARLPHFDAREWTFHIGAGIIMACVALIGLWLVCGRAQWWWRLIVAPIVLVLLTLTMRVLLVGQWLLYYWLDNPAYVPRYWQRVQQEGMWHNSQYWLTTFSLSILLLCAWLVLARQAGWFDPFHDCEQRIERRFVHSRMTRLARWGAALVFALVSLLPLALLYRLTNPVPFPVETVPEPNGFDDLIAAGKPISDGDTQKLANWSNLSDGQLRAALMRYAGSLSRMREGLGQPSWYPYLEKHDWPAEFYNLFIVAGAQAELARRTGGVQEKMAASWDMLRIAHEATRGAGARWNDNFHASEWQAGEDLWGCRSQLSARQCVELAANLSTFDARREPWDSEVKRQLASDSHAGWHSHLFVILSDWSGEELYASDRDFHFRLVAQVRTLVAELGIRAYQLENARLPSVLTDLLPRYLPAIPDDPFGNGPVKYVVTGDTYQLYSIGPDGKDDNGRPIAAGSEDGDLVRLDPVPASGSQTVAAENGENITKGDEVESKDATDTKSPP